MGRIKEISRKSVHTRKRNPVVYLICEGSETEIRYFKRFRSRGCNIDIIPISSQYKSADRLVQKAKATMGNNPYYPEDGDSIWCVFDRDDNSNEVLLRAKQSAQKEGYHLAYSNPSFELWFLLHFVNQQAEVEDCQALIPLLKQTNRIPDYEKNKDYFDVLKPLQATAIQRAKARACQIQCQGIEPISRQSNPLTTVQKILILGHSAKSDFYIFLLPEPSIGRFDVLCLHQDFQIAFQIPNDGFLIIFQFHKSRPPYTRAMSRGIFLNVIPNRSRSLSLNAQRSA